MPRADAHAKRYGHTDAHGDCHSGEADAYGRASIQLLYNVHSDSHSKSP